MSEWRELYQELIIDHGKNPRNLKKLSDATHTKEGFNPLCGDRLIVYLKIVNNKIVESSFEGSGCAISTASASFMTEALKNKSLPEAQKIFDDFHAMVMGDKTSATETLGKLSVLQGVCEFPSRVKCATLAWHTMMATLNNTAGNVSTE